MPRCAGYRRVSKFRRKDDKVSPETQKEAIIKLAVEDGYAEDDIDWYTDLDYSGKDTDRKEFPKMMEKVRRGEYKHIYCYDLFRFSRNVLDFHTNAKILDECGCQLKAACQHVDVDTIEGELGRNILVDVGDYQRKKIAIDVKRNMYTHAEKGNWNGGPVPYGFALVNKKLATDENAIANVGFIIDSFAQGHGANYVIDYFYNHIPRIKSPTGKDKWCKNTIVGIVRNPIYIMKYRWGGNLYNADHVFADDKVMQYISEENWLKANDWLDRRGETAPRTYGSQHLLSSLIRCPFCGKNLNIRYNGRSHNLVRRYVCPSRNDYLSGQKCECPVIDADSVETSVVRAILDLANEPDIIENYVREYKRLVEANKPDYAGQKKRLEAELQRIKKDMKDMFALFRRKRITEKQLGEQNAELLEEERVIEEKLAEIEQKETVAAQDDENIKVMSRLILTLNDLWPNMTTAEKRELISGLIKKINITPDGIDLDFGYFNLPVKYRLKTRTTILF